MTDPIPRPSPGSPDDDRARAPSRDRRAARPGAPGPGDAVHRRAVAVLRWQMGTILLLGAVLAGLLAALALVLPPA